MATAPIDRPTIEPGTQLMGSGIAVAEGDKDPVLPRQGVPSLIPIISAEIVDPSKLPNPRPPKMLFGGLHDLNLRLIKPIPLDVSVEESHVVVGWSSVDEYGAGETLSAALDDFGNAVRQVYYRLQEAKELGPDLSNVKQVLDEFISVRPK